jgi:hypothetical protein
VDYDEEEMYGSRAKKWKEQKRACRLECGTKRRMRNAPTAERGMPQKSAEKRRGKNESEATNY